MPVTDDLRVFAQRAERELDSVHDFFEYSKAAAETGIVNRIPRRFDRFRATTLCQFAEGRNQKSPGIPPPLQ